MAALSSLEGMRGLEPGNESHPGALDAGIELQAGGSDGGNQSVTVPAQVVLDRASGTRATEPAISGQEGAQRVLVGLVITRLAHVFPFRGLFEGNPSNPPCMAKRARHTPRLLILQVACLRRVKE